MIDWDSCVLWLDSKYFSESYWWDRSRYRNNGVIQGAKWKGNAFYFDGVNDYVNCGNHESLHITDEITIEVWVNASTNTDWARIVNKYYHSAQKGWNLIISNDNKFLFEIWSPGGVKKNVKSTTTAENTGWHYVVATYNKQYLKIYIDGVQEDSLLWSEPIVDNPENLTIGFDYHDGHYLNATIRQVRIYNKALSGEEIKILNIVNHRRW